MRESEILFRAKEVKTGAWAYGYPEYRWSEAGKRWLLHFGNGGRCEIDPETLGQYTGLTDKNHVDIFEGDIVKYQLDNDDCPFPDKDTTKRLGRVFYSDFRASFSIAMGRNYSRAMNNDLYKYVQNGNRVEVIGNKWDGVVALSGKEVKQ